MEDHLLSVLMFIPCAGALLVLAIPRGNDAAMKIAALAAALVTFCVSLFVLAGFDATSGRMQFLELHSWVPDAGISYYLGIDGLSLPLIVLTAFFTPLCILASWADVKRHVKEFMLCLLLLETGMVGVFVSLDLFLFYVFWEVMLIPMCLLIGIWGNPDRRVYAAVKFFLYTMFGSVLMLVAMLYLYFQHHAATGIYTFNILQLHGTLLPMETQLWLFSAFCLAFAIKVPIFPLHTWLPDAHTEAPTVGSVLLAAVLLKMGIYGFLRLSIPLFPNAAVDYGAVFFAVLGVAGILYGAWVCMVQKDLKRLIAFSSVSHMGFVMLGISAMTVTALQGAVIQMINHGLSTGALFLLVGMLYERRHTRMLADYGGLFKVMPVFGVIFLIAALSSLGLPGLNGFVGELLILMGSFARFKVLTIIAASGVIFAAVYILWMFQRVMYGEIT
ncbi:MAG: NADH-quinone oxidoreductase subunit M, partial [Pseudomonadota bacterium]